MAFKQTPEDKCKYSKAVRKLTNVIKKIKDKHFSPIFRD